MVLLFYNFLIYNWLADKCPFLEIYDKKTTLNYLRGFKEEYPDMEFEWNDRLFHKNAIQDTHNGRHNKRHLPTAFEPCQ